MPPITFIDQKQDDHMVIKIEIKNFAVKKMLVDQGSSVDLYWKTFKKLELPEDVMHSYDKQIIDFTDERVNTRGFVNLYTTFGEDAHTKTIPIMFLVMDANMSYNILLGRHSLNLLGAIVSTPHLAL